MRIDDRVGDARDLHHFGDVVHAHDVRAAQNAGGDGGGSAPDALVLRRAAENLPDEAFARRADQQRKTKPRKFRQPREQFVILR